MKRLEVAFGTKWHELYKYDEIFNEVRRNPKEIFSQQNFIGKGANSKVYYYEGYVLKRLRRKLIKEESYLREFTMFTVLNHLNLPVPKLYAYDTKEEVLLVEHVEGELLHKYIKRLMREEGPQKVWRFFYSLVDVIIEFYQKDIVPIDTHGKNIVIKEDGSIVFIDIDCFTFVEHGQPYENDICELDFLMNFYKILNVSYDKLHSKTNTYVSKKGFTY